MSRQKSYKSTDLTDRALEIFCERSNFRLPTNPAMKKEFLKHHGGRIQLIERHLRKGVKNG